MDHICVVMDIYGIARIEYLMYHKYITISIGLRGNFESNGFTYATPFQVIVCLGVNDVLFGCNDNDTTPDFPSSTLTLFLTVSGTEIC